MTREFWIDTAERAVSTFLQVLVIALFATTGDLAAKPNWAAAAIAGLVAAGCSVVTSLASIPLPEFSDLVDLLLRVVKTFIQAYVGVLVAANYTDVDWAGAMATALSAALLALVKGLAATHVPGTVEGASLVPVSAAPGLEVAREAVEAPPTGGRHAAPPVGQSFADPGVAEPVTSLAEPPLPAPRANQD